MVNQAADIAREDTNTMAQVANNPRDVAMAVNINGTVPPRPVLSAASERPVRSRFAAPHAQRTDLKASVNNALLERSEYRRIVFRMVLAEPLQKLSIRRRMNQGDVFPPQFNWLRGKLRHSKGRSAEECLDLLFRCLSVNHASEAP